MIFARVWCLSHRPEPCMLERSFFFNIHILPSSRHLRSKWLVINTFLMTGRPVTVLAHDRGWRAMAVALCAHPRRSSGTMPSPFLCPWQPWRMFPTEPLSSPPTRDFCWYLKLVDEWLWHQFPTAHPTAGSSGYSEPLSPFSFW